MLQLMAHTTLKSGPAEEVRKIITVWVMAPRNLADKLLMCQINLLPPSAGQKNHQHLSTTTQNVTIEDDILIVTGLALPYTTHYTTKKLKIIPRQTTQGKKWKKVCSSVLHLLENFILTLSRRTTYIYMCRAVRSLKSRMTYLYVATSVMKFGAILFTPIRHTAEFCFAVDS